MGAELLESTWAFPIDMPCEHDCRLALVHRWDNRSLYLWDLFECATCRLVVTHGEILESMKRRLWANHKQSRLATRRRFGQALRAEMRAVDADHRRWIRESLARAKRV